MVKMFSVVRDLKKSEKGEVSAAKVALTLVVVIAVVATVYFFVGKGLNKTNESKAGLDANMPTVQEDGQVTYEGQ